MLWSGFFLANPFGQGGRLLKLALIGFVFFASADRFIAIYSFQIRRCANSCRSKLALFFQIAFY